MKTMPQIKKFFSALWHLGFYLHVRFTVIMPSIALFVVECDDECENVTKGSNGETPRTHLDKEAHRVAMLNW